MMKDLALSSGAILAICYDTIPDPVDAKRLRMQLVALDTAASIDDLDIPGFKLHPLKGSDRGRWSIWVNGNWRITFEFRDGHAFVQTNRNPEIFA
ncbi:MAG: type II toxin-antitoxin system RelE/ParE family toxin [Gammaproteobacteria bacterium]|nr:type II toxin-antitoxin system RelE/ParE family toxin [Gammaproteobacteria bacterium]